jgi:hypothetical protein
MIRLALVAPAKVRRVDLTRLRHATEELAVRRVTSEHAQNSRQGERGRPATHPGELTARRGDDLRRVAAPM